MKRIYRSRKDNNLPHNWRQQVVNLLKAKGITITVVRISTLMRGSASDPMQEKKIAAAIKKLQVINSKKQPLAKLLEN